MSEPQKAFEVELRVRTVGQPDAVLNREYITSEKQSTDGAAREIWAGISNDVKAKCRAVSDGD
jgi:hypothetical protein